jgi:hypothetical protein
MGRNQAAVRYWDLNRRIGLCGLGHVSPAVGLMRWIDCLDTGLREPDLLGS